jgi:hypothetical protein
MQCFAPTVYGHCEHWDHGPYLSRESVVMEVVHCPKCVCGHLERPYMPPQCPFGPSGSVALYLKESTLYPDCYSLAAHREISKLEDSLKELIPQENAELILSLVGLSIPVFTLAFPHSTCWQGPNNKYLDQAKGKGYNRVSTASTARTESESGMIG